jgi:hypothetical protein
MVDFTTIHTLIDEKKPHADILLAILKLGPEKINKSTFDMTLPVLGNPHVREMVARHIKLDPSNPKYNSNVFFDAIMKDEKIIEYFRSPEWTEVLANSDKVAEIINLTREALIKDGRLGTEGQPTTPGYYPSTKV